ncbi:hypothetical protein [Streptomyces sp. NPDC049949]|uniref:hypothetical protein n=1 Tax=Streptomyces sp. NPDC049949 TaxID=3154627 RepID=UPI0034341085
MVPTDPKETVPPMHMKNSTVWSVFLSAVLTATLAGCGDGSGAKPDADAVAAAKAANTKMQTESFHSSGTTTAFAGGKQEMWSDPVQGLHVEVTGATLGDVYCKDGTAYTSADLFAAALRQRGQQVTVPAELRSAYVTTKAEGGCAMYFKIAETGRRAKGKDRTVAGRQAGAVQVGDGKTEDVYFIDDAEQRLLLLESRRDGRTSTTTYDSFGERFTISMPAAERTLTMDAFRYRVTK